MQPDKVNLAAKLQQFHDHWKPRTVAQLNGQEHQPYAERETSVLLIEPTGTPNTGDPATAAPRQEL